MSLRHPVYTRRNIQHAICNMKCVCKDLYVLEKLRGTNIQILYSYSHVCSKTNLHAGGYIHAQPRCSSKLHVSFAKEPYKRNYVLQKRPIIWSLLCKRDIASRTAMQHQLIARMHTPCLFLHAVVYVWQRELKNIGLLCKRALQKRLCSAKETYHLRVHPRDQLALHRCARCYVSFAQQAPNDRSLLHNTVSFIRLFRKRDMYF